MMMRMSLVARVGWGTPSMLTYSGGKDELVPTGKTLPIIGVGCTTLGLIRIEC